jgi:hypothetical protein
MYIQLDEEKLYIILNEENLWELGINYESIVDFDIDSDLIWALIIYVYLKVDVKGNFSIYHNFRTEEKLFVFNLKSKCSTTVEERRWERYCNLPLTKLDTLLEKYSELALIVDDVGKQLFNY